MNPHDSQSQNAGSSPDSVQDAIYFLCLKFRESVNSQVRRLLSASGIDVDELENDLEKGRNSDTVQRAKELLASFSGDPYAVTIRVDYSANAIKLEASQHYFPINPVTLQVEHKCKWCGLEGPVTEGHEKCP